MSTILKHFPKTFLGNDINEVVYKAVQFIKQHHDVAESRNGPSHYITRSEMLLMNPKERYLNLEGRSSNIIQMMAETMWVMSGSGDINPFLSYFLPRAKDYSDNGVTWRGAYGPRMYAFGQLEDAVAAFKEDGVGSRRAVISIYNPEIDSKEGIEKSSAVGSNKTKDLPCNDFMQLWICNDNQLHLEVFQRSGDVIWGAGSINLFEFSFFQECMLAKINEELNLSLTLGSYCHRTTNLHYYPEVVGKQIEAICDKRNPVGPVVATSGEVLLSGRYDMKTFFARMLDTLTHAINGSFNNEMMFDLFTSDEMVSSNTTYVSYCVILCHILGSEVEGSIVGEHHPQMLSALKASKFSNIKLL